MAIFLDLAGIFLSFFLDKQPGTKPGKARAALRWSESESQKAFLFVRKRVKRSPDIPEKGETTAMYSSMWLKMRVAGVLLALLCSVLFVETVYGGRDMTAYCGGERAVHIACVSADQL